MTRADAVEFFKRQAAGWNACDPDALARDYADDGTTISPIFRTVQGKDAILESFRALFETFPDWQYIGQELLVDGDKVLAGPKALGKAKVTAKVVGEAKGPKITGFTYKNKTNNRRRWGHRQRYSTIEITTISKG